MRDKPQSKQKTSKSNRQFQHPVSSPIHYLQSTTYIKIQLFLPWLIALVYFAGMAFLTFRYHTVGGLGVETDFYAELVPEAKKILSGELSPLNYGAKGPVYSFLLAGMYLVVREYFTAGLLLNLVSSAVFLITLFFLVKRIFTEATAYLVVCAIMFNPVFQSYTYQAGSDMPFIALCSLSVFFIFRSERTHDLVLSAICGLVAFLTRYNGVFLVTGTIVFLMVTYGTFITRLKRIGLWLAVFIIAGLVWFIPNWKVNGSPVYNGNYINVMMEFYALGKEGVTSENWTQALPKDYKSLGDIFLYNPIYFMKKMGKNALRNMNNDLRDLLGLRLGILTVFGFICALFLKPDRKKLVYFSFGIFYFLILTLIFYNVRFSLYLLVFYLPFAFWPFLKIKKHLKSQSWIIPVILGCLIATYAYTSTKTTCSDLTHQPFYLTDLKELGLYLGRIEPDKSQKIIARKPHVAYYAGLNALMFPEQVRSVGELVAYCREQDIRYILYSGIEAQARPHLQELLNITVSHPGLEEVYHNTFGVIYRIKE